MSASPTTTSSLPATPAAPGNQGTLPYAGPATPPPVSDWSPLRNPIFRAMWIASAISYTGFEIRNYAAPALMQDFRGVFGVSNGMAAYTFTASTLPIPLLVLFAGALADVVDRRKLLILTHLGMMIVAGLLGVLTIAHAITPWTMLGFLFVIGAGYAMMNPALLAVLPELVSPAELRSALALNGLNMNIARVAGPAIGGGIVLLVGKAHFWAGKGIAFLFTALSLTGVIWVLMNWKPEPRKAHAHPESVLGAVRTSFRYTFNSSRLMIVLARVFLFIVCAGILPTFAIMICKNNVAKLHGDLGSAIWMVCLGIGAIIGVYYMQAMQRRFGIEEVVVVCTLAYGLAVLGVAHTPNLFLGCLAMFVAGFNWVIVPTNFNISTQLAVPAWIKGRAMGMYVLVLWGSFAAGSAIFGRLATAYSPRTALSFAGIGVLVGAIPILWLRLVPKHKEDFAPVKRDPLPAVEPSIIAGPVAVAVDYRVASSNLHDFRHLMRRMHHYRRRNGAMHWALDERPGADGLATFTESFHFASWPERVRSHDRTTKFDTNLEDQVLALNVGEPPAMRHSADVTLATTECFFTRTRDTFLRGVARELPKLFDRLHNSRRYGWDGKTRPW
jgi:MFS family permease